ncbi:hypothetical protein CYMTET_18509 [Cymbomonas tetramitiformis]|uniref:Uncharacterized protein n=1 Tax=Cymbomonas tetramitiformis TaxID=36881 RepID=A0AAE0L643_9CHLO|nr:hypothetical protein CYMTET_18509 [Cymbomonas tetramitiformis]
MLYGLVHYTGRMAGYQDTVQRYLCTSSLKEARRAIALSAVLSVPTWGLFYFVGTCLYVFYKHHESSLPEGTEADAVFPHFILHEMPTGFTGVVIAGVLAAAMSSMDSSLNSVSAVVVTDICKRCWLRGCSDRTYLVVARVVNALTAAVMIGVAIMLVLVSKESINDAYNAMVGVLGGASTALFLLALLGPRRTHLGNVSAIFGARATPLLEEPPPCLTR